MYAFQFRTEQDRGVPALYRPGIFIVGMIMCLQSSISWHIGTLCELQKGPPGVGLALLSSIKFLAPQQTCFRVALSQSSLLISRASNPTSECT